MTSNDRKTSAFDASRGHLRAVAYRLLGSLTDVDDALQETWLRYDRTDTSGIDNLDAWLTTVVSRVCLNILRTRSRRAETDLPDPVVSMIAPDDPEAIAVRTDEIGYALLVVLDALAPDARVAFVLHDLFDVPHATVAAILETTPESARQLASRGPRNVRRAPQPPPHHDPPRAGVGAFLAATRDGNLTALVNVLHPDVVLRTDGGGTRPNLTMLLRGADRVARQAAFARNLAPFVTWVHVNGSLGLLATPAGQPWALMAFTVTDGRISELSIILDPARLPAPTTP